MQTSELKDLIRAHFTDRHFARLWFTVKEVTHAFTNVNVEPLRRIKSLRYRPAKLLSTVGITVRPKNDLAYFLGHITAVVLGAVSMALLGVLGQFILAALSCLFGAECRF